ALDELYQTETIPPSAFDTARRVRIDLERAIRRTNKLRDAFPERYLAPLWGVPVEPSIPLPAEDEAMVARMAEDFEPARLDGTMAMIVGLVGLLLAVLCAFLGFKHVKVKRYIEN